LLCVACALVAGLGRFSDIDPYFCLKFTYLKCNK
jgi:hypothetical protein